MVGIIDRVGIWMGRTGNAILIRGKMALNITGYLTQSGTPDGNTGSAG
jgi:hypothetical protein